MNIALIGSGGREHALCQKMSESQMVKNIICMPGNAGTAKIAKNIDLNVLNFRHVLNVLKLYKIDLVIVGPEEPLVKGIVNFLEKHKIKVFGPNKAASQLEGSKIFTKNLCKEYKIPTANFGVFNNIEKSLSFLKKCNFPIVVKADGLASGKGVYICENLESSKDAITEIFDGKFGEANEILIEEFLEGEEMSFFIISDGTSYKKFGTAQDHKRVLEGDKGKNTGGMGAYSPSRLENETLDKKILERIIEPTLKGLKNLETEFVGFLYAGLMIVKGEPFLIEYNVRMGDPECQVIMPRLKTDIVKIFLNTLENKLKKTKIMWHKKKCMTIVLCSKGYPGSYKKGKIIQNLNKLKLEKKSFIYHAGTKISNGSILSNGGRVLNVTSMGDNFFKIRRRILSLIKKINWKYGFYRKDIGWKVIK